jgi:hypothetical protein
MAVLRRRLGRSATELVLVAANAAAHGIGQSPTALTLDATLRGGQLTEAVARATAFDAAHDTVCAAERLMRRNLRCTCPREAAQVGSPGLVVRGVISVSRCVTSRGQ